MERIFDVFINLGEDKKILLSCHGEKREVTKVITLTDDSA